MRRIWILASRALAASFVLVGGCQMAGPTSIGMGRDRYNHVLQATAIDQTMSNIVRVYEHEPPMFLDVTEVDASLSFSGSLSGGATGIGARRGTSGGTLAGQVGAASGGLGYAETPTIRYQPLLGQPLVAQLVTPVSVDALGLMFDSLWDVAPLLDFSSAYLTLDYRQFYPALNTITELSHREALELAATRSFLTASEADAAGGGGAAKAGAAHGTTNNDSLMIYLRPFRDYENAEDWPDTQRVVQLWIRLVRIYLNSQPPFEAPAECAATVKLSMDAASLRDWDVHIADKFAKLDDKGKSDLLGAVRRCVPTALELRVVPIPLVKTGSADSQASVTLASRAPVMRTYSALGILKNATERPGPKVEFVTPEQYQEIRSEPWNADVESLSYYTLLPSDLDSFGCSQTGAASGGCDNPLPQSMQPMFSGGRIEAWIRTSTAPAEPPTAAPSKVVDAHPFGLGVIEKPGEDVLKNEYILLNGRLGTLRRYILVIVSDKPPQTPVYASYADRGHWFYIERDDTVSEKNFQLLSLFMTMMAVPPSTQPLSPVINVGNP